MPTYHKHLTINETDNGQEEIWQGVGEHTLNGEVCTFAWYATPGTVHINDESFNWPAVAGGSVHGAIIAAFYQSNVASAFLSGL